MNLAVIGSGTMGSGIAQVAATFGCTVKIFDTNEEALSKSKLNLENTLSKLVEKDTVSYLKLNEKGYAPEESIINNGDAIIGKFTHTEAREGSDKYLKDASEIYMDLLKSMNHRINLLDEMNQSLTIHDRKNNWEISELDVKTTFELKQLKEETKSILEECNTIHKAVAHPKLGPY